MFSTIKEVIFIWLISIRHIWVIWSNHKTFGNASFLFCTDKRNFLSATSYGPVVGNDDSLVIDQWECLSVAMKLSPTLSASQKDRDSCTIKRLTTTKFNIHRKVNSPGGATLMWEQPSGRQGLNCFLRKSRSRNRLRASIRWDQHLNQEIVVHQGKIWQ